MKIMDYDFEENLLYDEEHNWLICDENKTATVGVTDFFQKMADEIVFVEVPLVGRKIEKGKPYSSIESGKWVGRLKAPVTGEIVEVNNELTDFPYLLNDSPYDEGWVIKLKPDNMDELNELYNLEIEEHVEKFKKFIEIQDKEIKESME